jgi:hypothetical protein
LGKCVYDVAGKREESLIIDEVKRYFISKMEIKIWLIRKFKSLFVVGRINPNIIIKNVSEFSSEHTKTNRFDRCIKGNRYGHHGARSRPGFYTPRSIFG